MGVDFSMHTHSLTVGSEEIVEELRGGTKCMCLCGCV